MRRTTIAVMGGALVVVALVATAVTVAGQRRRASPHESTDGTVDGATLMITYGRPYMRGRKIMGSLVPYDRVWCPGADEATELETTKPIHIGEMTLKAGAYTIWMLPTATDWTMIVNSQTGLFHTFHPASSDIGRVKMQKRTLTEPVEQLTFAIEKNPNGAGGILRMTWETTDVSVPFTVQ